MINNLAIKSRIVDSIWGNAGGGRKCKVEDWYKLENFCDDTLIFESRFESGNLATVVRVSCNEYNLMLQNDVNTKGHTQWFYFKVKNTTKGYKVIFNLINFTKPDSS